MTGSNEISAEQFIDIINTAFGIEPNDTVTVNLKSLVSNLTEVIPSDQTFNVTIPDD